MAFDVLAHPAAGFPDLRPRPYMERRQVLLDVLADAGPPIVPVWSTTDQTRACTAARHAIAAGGQVVVWTRRCPIGWLPASLRRG